MIVVVICSHVKDYRMADLNPVWQGAVELPIGSILPDSRNCNKMSEKMFSELVQEIKTDGFDEPVIVVLHPEQPGRYLLVNGEHRWRAASSLGMPTIPAVIKESWDAATRAVKLIRRNNLHGELDSVQFSSLLAEIENSYSMSKEEMAVAMCFDGVEDMLKHVPKESALASDGEDQGQKNAKKVVAGLQQVINKLVSEFGWSLQQGFIFFLFGGKQHMAVDMDEDLRGLVEATVRHCEKMGLTMADVLGELLGKHVTSFPEEERVVKTKNKRKSRNKKETQDGEEDSTGV